MKITKELVYKKGIAIVLLAEEETASEYSGECKYRVELYFKSKNAISNAARILGYKLERKKTLESYVRGRNGFIVDLNEDDMYELKAFFQCKNHIGGGGYYYSYENHYSDTRIHQRINPSNIFHGIDDRVLETGLGSCADSTGTFGEYLSSIVNKIEAGIIYYCPNIY